MTRRGGRRLVLVVLAAIGVSGIVAAILLVASELADDPRDEIRVVLREGRSMLDYAEALERAGVTKASEFLAACRDPALLHDFDLDVPDAEGFLFPDTYRFRPGMPADTVVRRMLANFRRRVRPLVARRRAAFDEIGAKLGADPLFAVVTIASIVEAETASPPERPVIASVAWNRLTGLDPEIRMLQMDPTVSYGCRRMPDLSACAGWSGGAPTRTMLRDETNPWNTYRVEGLPAGPIGNPGLAAVEAVLERRETAYLFYVARGDGTHAFSRTYEEHARAVRQYLGR